MGGAAQDKKMEFSRSILKGVEIKLCRNDAHAYKPHVHNELSLGYIVEGSTVLTLNHGIVRFLAGDGVVIPQLMTHICAPQDVNRWAYAMLFVDPGYYGDAVKFQQVGKLSAYQTGALIGLIERLLKEKNPDDWRASRLSFCWNLGKTRRGCPGKSGRRRPVGPCVHRGPCRRRVASPDGEVRRMDL